MPARPDGTRMEQEEVPLHEWPNGWLRKEAAEIMETQGWDILAAIDVVLHWSDADRIAFIEADWLMKGKLQ